MKIEKTAIERIQRKEKRNRNLSTLLTLAPFIAGALWLIFTYGEVKTVKNDVKIAQIAKDSLTNEVAALEKKKRDLEIDLSEKNGLNLPKVLNTKIQEYEKTSSRKVSNVEKEQIQQTIIDESILANDALKKMKKSRSGRVPKENITVRHYAKDMDLDKKKIDLDIVADGYTFIRKEPFHEVADIETNAIWFGSSVPLRDVKIIALYMMRAGYSILSIKPFDRAITNPEFKATFIEVGSSNQYLEHKPYTIDQIISLKTSDFISGD